MRYEKQNQMQLKHFQFLSVFIELCNLHQSPSSEKRTSNNFCFGILNVKIHKSPSLRLKIPLCKHKCHLDNPALLKIKFVRDLKNTLYKINKYVFLLGKSIFIIKVKTLLFKVTVQEVPFSILLKRNGPT